MNLDQVQAYIGQHKPVVLGAAAAGVVGLALVQRRKAGTAAPAGTPRPAGTIPAAAVVPSQQTSSTYDSSAFDVYNALGSQLGQLSEQIRQTTGGGITTAPDPVASPLLTNTDWMNAAVTKYVKGGGSVRDITNTLNHYLNGWSAPAEAMTGADWAVKNFGAPPEGTKGMIVGRAG